MDSNDRPGLPAADHPPGPRKSHVDCPPEPPIRTALHALLLFPCMEPMLRSIVDAVNNAKDRVWIETYIYRGDKLGSAFADAMVAAARRGADARLLYDPLGCNETDPAFFESLAARGVKVRPYLPRDAALKAGTPFNWDHSRIVVIDDAGYTGGAAWGDEWLPAHRGGKGWHDVCTRVEGPVVTDFAHVFSRRWNEAEGENGSPEDFTTGDRYPDLEFLSDAPDGRPLIIQRYCDRIRTARDRVWMEIAYFFPPVNLLKELYDAAARGVDVRVILPADSDLPILKRAARAEFIEWIERGLKIFEYGASMVHSKFALIDDDWSTVGTFNANATSVRFANEVNLIVRDRVYVERVAELFRSDLEECELVTIEAVRSRPLLEQVHDAIAHATLALAEPGTSHK